MIELIKIQIDLSVMIDGFDGDRGTSVAGGRGYFLKVLIILNFLLCIFQLFFTVRIAFLFVIVH